MSRTTTTRLALPQVTLVCVDTRTPTLGLAAMERSRRAVDFGDAVLFSAPDLPLDLPPGIRHVPVDIGSVPDYSQFMLRGLATHIHTSHLLVVQWDGWLTNASAWTDEFLDHDYIGPAWVDQPAGREVGNGGFSLRSARLLRALADPAITPTHPEDECICRTYRERLERVHQISFAPVALARRFAHEHEPPPASPTLGFHGVFNLHLALADDALITLMDALTPAQCWGMGGRMLWRALLRRGRFRAARAQLRRVRQLLSPLQRLRYSLQLAWAIRQSGGIRQH